MTTNLSVGIPVFNQGDFVGEAIESLLDQSVPPCEIVVSDNHSTDRTAQVLAKYRNRIRIVSPPIHLGMMSHWNFVAREMKGDWFALLSSDDVARPIYVETLVRGARRDVRAVLVRAGWENIDQGGNVLEERYLLSVRKCVRPPTTFYENLNGPKTSFAAFAVKKCAWERVGGFPERLCLLGDWGMWIQLSPLGTFVYEDRLISGYRTDYRHGIVTKRLGDWIGDELQINFGIIPEVAASLQRVDYSKVERASRRRFLYCLGTISQHLEEKDRTAIAAKMEPWARAVSCDRQLGAFVRGEIIRPPRDVMRRSLRRILGILRR